MINYQIHLTTIDNEITWWGENTGLNLYERQVKPLVKAKNILANGDEMTIYFPHEIVAVSSSFIEGFFRDLIRRIGLVEVRKRIHICSAHPDVVRKVRLELFY